MARATPKSGKSSASLRQAVRMLRVTAHPLRIRLLERLERTPGAMSVNELARQVRQPQHIVSQHLSRMYLYGLLRRRSRGRQVFYRVRDEQILEIVHWVRRYQEDPSWVEEGEAI